MPKLHAKEQAAITIKLLNKEGSARNSAQQSVVYTLLLMHYEDVLPEVDLTKAFRAQGRVEQQKRNDAILHKVFEVTTQETDEKTQRVSFRPKEGLGFSVNVLKTRINRSLAVVAYIIAAADRLGGLNKVVELNRDNTLSVSGEAYYSDEDRENAPNLAKNWIALSGKAQEGHGTFNRLMRVADNALDYQRAVTRRRKVQEADLTEIPLAVVVKSLNARLGTFEKGDKLSAWERAELQTLAELASQVVKLTRKPGRPAKVAKVARPRGRPRMAPVEHRIAA